MEHSFTQQQLVTAFSGCRDRAFNQACDHIKSQVPEKIQVNGKVLKHYPLFYVPERELYYYFDQKFNGSLFTKEEANQAKQ